MAPLDTQELCRGCAIAFSPGESSKNDLLPAGIKCFPIGRIIDESIWRFGSDYRERSSKVI